MFKQNLHRALPAAYALCLFAFILGARWAVFDRFGMDLPEWDQWDAEGLFLLAPWFAHDNFLAALFTPHNEHRVVLTKLLNLGLTLGNGQWDQRLEAVVNAFLPASIAVALFLLGRRHLAPRTLAPLWLFLAAAFGLPFAWQNILGGFHSQQFFLVGLAFIAIALLPFARPFSTRWWCGATAAVLGLFSMASGFFGAAIVLVLLGVRLLRRETTFRTILPAAALCTIVCAVGWFTRHEVEYHATLKAQNLHDFVFTLLHSLQWPAPFTVWFALVMWLPWTWLTFRLIASPRASSPASAAQLSSSARAFGYLIIGLGGWVWLQFIATGYARGAGGPIPASRYIDTVVFGLVANALALAWLATSKHRAEHAAPAAPPVARATIVPRAALLTLIVVWIGLFIWGGSRELHQTLVVELPPVKVYHDFAAQNVRNYLLTGNVAHLNHDEIPYPGAGAFLVRIGIPSLRERLPASVRPPLPLTPALTTFVASNSHLIYPPAPGLSPLTHPLVHRPTWGSFSSSISPTAPREFTSAPLRARLGGWLKFETSGHVGATDVLLELRDAHTGASLAAIRPDKTPGDTWRAAYVRAPRVPFVVHARAPDATRWLAFSEPVEMATGSHLAWQLAKNGQLIATFALALVLLLSAAAFFVRQRASTAAL